MAVTESSTLFVDYAHLTYWSNTHVKGFVEAITERHYRFLPFLKRGLEACIRRYEPEYWGKTGRGGQSETVSSYRLSVIGIVSRFTLFYHLLLLYLIDNEFPLSLNT